MSTKKTIAKSFTVSTIEDGVSVQAQYAPNANPTSGQIHTVWQNGDLYMRTKQSNETTWSSWHKIVGENGDETDYTFNISKSLTSTNATTEPADCYYNTWQDAPVAPTSTYPYLWMKIVKKTWNESTQSYDSGTARYARVTGEKGENAFVVDLENEMTNVALDENGDLIANFDMYFKVRAYYGTTNVLSDSACTVSASCSDPNVTITDTNAKTTGIRVQISSGTHILDTTEVSVTVTHTTYGTRTVIFTLAGVCGGENAVLQELLPSLDAISFARTTAGGLTPSSRDLTLSIKKTQGGSTSTQSLSDCDLTIRWSSTSMPASKTDGNGWGNGTATGISWNNITMQIANTVAATNIYIAAFNSAGTLVDRETIPVIKDGNDGDDGVSYCIVFTKAAARVDENNIVTAELAGYAYKYVGGVRSALASTTIRHGYILTDSDTYATTTTNSSGFFDAGTWFNGDDITDYGKNSPSIFAAIVIDGTVVHAEMITISVKGGTGNRGKVGRFFYYAGEWNDFASTDSFFVNDAQAPYFYYNNNYWVFNPETNGTYIKQDMGTPSSSSSNWKLMTSDFKYIITEAIFGAYAHFGSFIINGDWLLSTNGKVGESVVSGESDIGGSVTGGSNFSVKAVTLFDSAYPSDGMVDIAYENNIVTIATSETTKQIMTVYLSASLTYRVSCDYSRSGGSGSFYVRIRNASYGSVVPIYLANTSGSSSGNFRVTTSGTYIVEIYAASTGYTASVWNTVVSRLLFAPMYAVDGKTGASYQGGNGVFRGFVRKQKTRITTSNIDQYKRTDITSATVLDFDKCGSFIELATGTYGYVTLPLMSDYLASRYTSKQIDDIRSFVGTTMLIYNKSGQNIPMTLRYNSDGSTTSGTLHNGNCVELECCLDADSNDGKEIIYWKVISYAEPVV